MLYTYLRDAALLTPHKIAVVSGTERCSYLELWERSSLLASLLMDDGIQPGERVVIVGANSIGTVIAWWAVLRCHAICVYLSESLKQSGFDFIVDDVCPSHFLCGSAAVHKLLPESIAPIDLDTIDWTPSIGMADTFALPSNLKLLASIVYTSGSTGVPKGVCLTHENLCSSGEISANGHGITSQDYYLMVVPLHYVHGQMMLVSLCMRGAKLEFMTSFVFPSAVTKKLKTQDITCLSGVPYHFSALLSRGEFLTTDLPSLRWIGVTGGALSPDKLLKISDSKPDLDIHIGYGQTECSPRITRLEPAKIRSKPSSIGSVEPGLQIHVLNSQGLPVAEGATGELVVSGPSVMHGYWNDPKGTAKVIDSQGRLHTGDLAYRDSDGDIFIRGRVQAMIKSAGERIFPEELEAILQLHPAVSDVAVIGEPDELYGQLVIAHVALVEADLESVADTLKLVEAHCLDHIPFARAPRRYQYWVALPRKDNGKIDKQMLVAPTEAKRL